MKTLFAIASSVVLVLLAVGVAAAADCDDFNNQGLPGSEDIDIVFLVDGSDTMETDQFDLQCEAIAKLVEYQWLDLYPDSGDTNYLIPRDGSVGLAVVQYNGGAAVEIDTHVINNDLEADCFVDQVGLISQIEGGTVIVEGIGEAIKVLDGSHDPSRLKPAGSESLVILMTDALPWSLWKICGSTWHPTPLAIPVQDLRAGTGVAASVGHPTQISTLALWRYLSANEGASGYTEENMHLLANSIDSGMVSLIPDKHQGPAYRDELIGRAMFLSGSFGTKAQLDKVVEHFHNSYLDTICPVDNDGGADCNNNGTPDVCEVRTGAARDCGTGGIYDSGNGVPDSCDIEADSLLDADEDGIINTCDNHASDNPLQTDCNSDGIGVAMDDTDFDGDGTPNNADNCVCTANPSQGDCDNDDVGDACQLPLMDCNGVFGDGVPDHGTLDDCDCDGISDSHDIEIQPELDECTLDGWESAPNNVLDSCEELVAWEPFWFDGLACTPDSTKETIDQIINNQEAVVGSMESPPIVWADLDYDNDVDQDDFGLMQLCITSAPVRVAAAAGDVPDWCLYVDRYDPTDSKTEFDSIDQMDLLAFEDLATGPNVPYYIPPPPGGAPEGMGMGGMESGMMSLPAVPMALVVTPVAWVDVLGNGLTALTVSEDSAGAGWSGYFTLNTGLTCDVDISGIQYAINVNSGSDNGLFHIDALPDYFGTTFGSSLFSYNPRDGVWYVGDYWAAAGGSYPFPLLDADPDIVISINYTIAATNFPGTLLDYTVSPVTSLPVGTYVFSVGDSTNQCGYIAASVDGSGDMLPGSTFTLTVVAP